MSTEQKQGQEAASAWYHFEPGEYSMTNSSTDRVSILLVEDHRVTLDGIASWLSAEEGFEIVGKAKDSQNAVRLAVELRPQITLLDLHLPGNQSIEETLIKIAETGTKIIVFSAEDRAPVIKLTMEKGASAFLSKSEAPELICQVIKDVFAGTTGYVSRCLRKPKRYELFPAEEEVLRMLARGMKYEEIGEARNTSPHTVRKQCERLQQKLGLGSREALIVWAVEHGFGAASSPD